MKKIAMLALMGAMSVSAFALKIGYVNSDAVFQNYSKTKTVESNLQKEKTRLENEIKTKEVALQKFQVELQGKGNAVTDAEKKKFEADVAAFQKFVNDAQTKLAKEEMTQLSAIEKTLNDAVLKVAKAGGYDYVLEAGAIKFGGEDVTSKVLSTMEGK